MASPSKEDFILKLFLENSPLKHWHFEEIIRASGVTRAVANKWLSTYITQGLLKKIKPPGKFPYYTVGQQNTVYYSFKRVYALQKFHDSGLLSALLSFPENTTVILFGSMINGDWYKESDIDVFVLGNFRNFDKKYFERRLHRNIELHVFENKRDLAAVKTGLLHNVLNGYVVKGRVQDVASPQ